MSPKKLAVLILAISMLYAVLRYHVLGDAPRSDIPLFIFNKALAYSGLVLLGIAGINPNKTDRHQLGMTAAYFLLVHVTISLALFSAKYYPKFFYGDDSNHLTTSASFSLLFGIVAFVCLIHLWRTSLHTRKGTDRSLINGLGRCVLALAVCHTCLMGFSTWFRPATWPGNLPPITLLACLSAVGFLLVTHRRKRPASGVESNR